MRVENPSPLLPWVPRIAVIGIGEFGNELIDHIEYSNLNSVESASTAQIYYFKDQTKYNLNDIHMAVFIASIDELQCSGRHVVVRQTVIARSLLSVCLLGAPCLEAVDHQFGFLRQFDILIVILNDNKTVFEPNSIAIQFERTALCLKGILELICEPGLIGIDFADVRSVLAKSGMGAVGIGESARPENANIAAARAREDLARQGVDLHSVSGFLVNFQSGNDTDILEMDTALNAFFDLPTEISKDNTNIMVGWLPKPPMNGRCRVVVVAAGVSLGDR
jgi:cell division GTPase FtsZ